MSIVDLETVRQNGLSFGPVEGVSVAYTGVLYSYENRFFVHSYVTGTLNSLPVFLTKEEHVITFLEQLQSHYTMGIDHAKRVLVQSITDKARSKIDAILPGAINDTP